MATRRKVRPHELRPQITRPARQMDPRLQRQLAQYEARGPGQARRARSASTAPDEVAVIAKVTDLADWQMLRGVRHIASIGAQDPADGSWIVTARVQLAEIRAVREQPFVKALKAAQRVRKQLTATLPGIRADAKSLPAGAGADGGAGVLLGVIDFGCAIGHAHFRHADGRTRLELLWDQNARVAAEEGAFGYGRLVGAEAIDAALTGAQPERKLRYAFYNQEPAHGTHVLDIAGGSGRAAGVAPRASLAFVELGLTDVPDTGLKSVGASFGDSVLVLEAAKLLFDAAGNRPCVVNLSLGMNGGPHDGSTLVEQGFDRLLLERPERAIVIAAANSYADGIHASGTVRAGQAATLAWEVGRADRTENELEVWYPGAHRLAAEIVAPNGRTLGVLAPGETLRVTADRSVVLYAVHRMRDSGNGDNVINLWQSARCPGGGWTVRLHGQPRGDTPYHAWIERDDAGQSRFGAPRYNSHTLGTFSCGQLSLVVASYSERSPVKRISWFSSSGPTRDGRHKPELSAPGHAVLAADSQTDAGRTRMIGTSMAAPAVAGGIALLFAAARRKGRRLTIQQLRQLLIDTARPMSRAGWDPRYGYGRVDIAAAIARLDTP
jgi:subtilisin family serine protease